MRLHRMIPFLLLFFTMGCSSSSPVFAPPPSVSSNLEPKSKMYSDGSMHIEEKATSLGIVPFDTTDTSGNDNVDFDYLIEEVPEVEEYKLMKQGINPDYDFYIYENPEAIFLKSTDWESEYYIVEVGERTGSETIHIWHKFAVEYELEDVLIYDSSTGKYITLDEWRSKK
ncbi:MULTISPECIES: hypothetical protein [Paenibacillus]|nr:hypothetical protein [Paenibacillus anaericanus]